MWYKIKKGMHRAFPLSLGIHTGKTSESYEVIFDESCRYIPDEENDWNKLVGWSYGILPIIKDAPNEFIPAHHRNSIRIGWRYNQESDKIEVCLYLYDSGIRKIREVRTQLLDLNIKYKLSLLQLDSTEGISFFLIANGEVVFIPTKMQPTWGYNLGLFFGGNAPAQHDTKVWLKKL